VAQARSASAGAPASAAVAALPRTTDILVVGGGIIGLTLALEFRRRHPDCGVTLIEKEAACGLHASGRNSGVLHAGFYYTPDSLKARFTRDGNRALTEYCERRGLPLRRCGKLVVARSRADLAGLDDLLRRGRAGSSRSRSGAARSRGGSSQPPVASRRSTATRSWQTARRSRRRSMPTHREPDLLTRRGSTRHAARRHNSTRPFVVLPSTC